MFDACVFSDEVADDFPEAARRAAAAGARQVEIRGKLFGGRIEELTPERVDRIIETCTANRIGIGSLGSPVGKCSIDDEEEWDRHDRIFDTMLDLVEAFDCPIVRGFALWAPHRGQGWERDLGRYLDRIGEFVLPKAGRAAERGAVLALENEWDTLFGTCEEGKRIMEYFGDPDGLGLVWDVANSLPLGESPYPLGYERIEPWIVHVHLKPNAGGAVSPLPGTDDVTIGELLARLWNDGYEGSIGTEHFAGPEATLEAVESVAATIDSIIEVSRRPED